MPQERFFQAACCPGLHKTTGSLGKGTELLKLSTPLLLYGISIN